MKMKRSIYLTIMCALFCSTQLYAQSDTLVLDLQSVINRANRESLIAFKAKNLYLAQYWQYRSFKADRLPSLSLDLRPIQYNRNFTKRYDYKNDIDIYRKQQSIYSSGSLALKQNFDLLGGTFFVDSELGFNRSFGDNTYKQYSTIPIRIGYRQSLLGYNPFKWEKKIEPLRFKVARQNLISNIEKTSEEATRYFFSLAMAQAQYDLATYDLKSKNKLFEIGEERIKIAGIRKSELNTLQLDKINAQNKLQNAKIALQRAMFALATYLGYDKQTKIALRLPAKPSVLSISVGEAVKFAKENNPSFLESKKKILELKQQVAKAKINKRFNASFSASVGFNQVGETFSDAYRSPSRQDIFAVTLSIPILDWGVRRGRYNVARSNLNVEELTAKENSLKIEEDITMTVGDFSVQQQLIYSAEIALDLAKMVYEQTQERFILGKADLNSITLANKRHQEAQNNYIRALQNYWISYFKIRRLTLFDFEKHQPIEIDFDAIENN